MSGSMVAMRRAAVRLAALAAIALSVTAVLRARRHGEVWHTLPDRSGDEGP